MSIKRILPFFFLLLTTNCFSQDKDNPHITNVTKINFLNPGISYEKSIARCQSIIIQGFMDFSLSLGYDENLGNTSTLYIDPALAIQYRYYYNLKRRQEKGKWTAMNSANYFAAIFQTTFSTKRISDIYYAEQDRRPVNIVGVTWGIQRNYRGRFSLDFNFGVGYLFTKSNYAYNAGNQLIGKNTGQFTIPSQLNLGFWLNKRGQFKSLKSQK